MMQDTVLKVEKYEGKIGEVQTMEVYWFQSQWIELSYLFQVSKEGEVT